MIQVFVDASVLVAAVLSPTGGASALLEMAIRGRVNLLISDDIVEEVKRNVPKLADKFEILLRLVPFHYVSVTAEDVSAALDYTVAKDAHVVAAAKKATVEYLVTFDEKHLLHNEVLKQNVTFSMLKPGDLLQLLRGTDESLQTT